LSGVVVALLIVPFVIHRTVSQALRLPECELRSRFPTTVRCSGHLITQDGNDVTFINTASVVAAVLFVLLYFCVLEGITGAGIGKRLLGIRVVKVDGSLVGVPRASLRFLLLVVADGLPTGFILGLVMSLTMQGHRRVGDLAAKTYVVRKDAVGRPVFAPPDPTAPYWDASRGAYLRWDPASGRYWMWDPFSATWR
jgi:hypothetical protein